MGAVKSRNKEETNKLKQPFMFDCAFMTKVQEVNEFCTLLNGVVLSLEHTHYVKKRVDMTADGPEKLSLMLQLHTGINNTLDRLHLLQPALTTLLKTVPFEIRLDHVHRELSRLDTEKLKKNVFDEAEIVVWKSVTENLIKQVNGFYHVYCPVFNNFG